MRWPRSRHDKVRVSTESFNLCPVERSAPTATVKSWHAKCISVGAARHIHQMLSGVASRRDKTKKTSSQPIGDNLNEPAAFNARSADPRGVRCGRRWRPTQSNRVTCHCYSPWLWQGLTRPALRHPSQRGTCSSNLNRPQWRPA